MKTLEQSKYFSELKKKLKEELNEYLETKNDEEAIEELSDVLEVIHSLSEIHGKGFKDVEEARQKKFNERGGFKEKVYLVAVDDSK
ncbi:phosphoribosyl-ATP pyrophosphohydrolase [Lentibacillus sp. L22]|uniref:phosphoribosyl-ATP pyrophosphohydrolase n=1 Tax=Lentibacillus sp. L22 TaxID=3163028 RepID=UPI003467D06B